MNKKWIFQSVDESLANQLAKELEISPLLGAFLVNRGIKSAEQGKKFFEGGLEECHSPLGLQGMEKAVERLTLALQQREKIAVYGDYDVDGITSTALLLKVLRRLGAAVDYYIPDRLLEGYGPNSNAFEKLAQQGTRVIVTVDCGINAVAEAKLARQLGMDLIITDHHEPGPELPDCLAVLNPKTSPAYPYPMLGGVGVAYKLAQAFLQSLSIPEGREILDSCLELVALGTVADVAPLDGENRILVKEGIRRLRLGRWLGIQSLCQVAGLESSHIDSYAIGFVLGPRLNAGGRIGDPKLGVELLLCQNKVEAYGLSLRLNAENHSRREIEKTTVDAAKKIAEEQIGEGNKVLVLAERGWHPGVVGLAASRVQEAFCRPSLVIALADGLGKGSARSQRPFHWVKALEHSAQHLVKWGGHEFAAGVTVREEKVPDLRHSLNQFAQELLTDEDFKPSLRVDLSVRLSQLTPGLMREINRLSPFGMRNAKPVFSAMGCRLMPGTRVVGAHEDHLKLVVRQGGCVMPGIAFKMGPDLARLKMDEPVDLAFQLSWNEFQGQRTLQLDVKDIRQPSVAGEM